MGHRLVGSDVGMVWFSPHPISTDIWEYNIYTQTGQVLGQLPAYATPTSIFWANGFTFVGFVSGEPGDGGNAYIAFFRGGQQGIIGPLRDVSDQNYYYPVILGIDGDDLIFRWSGNIWSYNLSDGGIHSIAFGTGATNVSHGIWYGETGFYPIHPPSLPGALGSQVSRVDRAAHYTGQSGTINSGQYDFGFFDIPKVLNDVTVIADPLPADTSIGLAYSVDGGSFTTHADTWNTDGETSYVFVVSNASTTVRGRRFEIRLILTTTDSANAPTIRSWTARATAAAHEREFTIAVDATTDNAGEQDGFRLIDSLHTLVVNQDLVTLSLPWENSEEEAAESVVVQVRDVTISDTDEDKMVAYVKLVARDLVTS
jgi:hypothetical protein